MKTLSGDQTTAVQADTVNIGLFFTLNLSPTPVRYWTGVGSLVVSSNTYLGAGNFVSAQEILETVQSTATTQYFTLNGIPTSLLNTALDDNSYIGKTVNLQLGFFDSSNALIGSLISIYIGVADTMSISFGPETSSISLSAVNGRVLWDRNNLSRYTSAEQQRLYAGDLGFQFVTSSIQQDVKWG